MPIHDWTRVDPGAFHDFYVGWDAELKKAMNNGVLPRGYYAILELASGATDPHVFPERFSGLKGEGAEYLWKQRRIVIRRERDDKKVAWMQIVSPGHKNNQQGFLDFVDDALTAIRQGCHLLIIDILPPGSRDPHGMHAAIWKHLDESDFVQPNDKPLTLVAYCAKPITAYLQPVVVGDVLPDMPLFLDENTYVPVPLEAAYREAWAGIASATREKLEP